MSIRTPALGGLLAIILGVWAIGPTARGDVLSTDTAIIASGVSPLAVGVPQNNGAFWDGSRYWLLYARDNALQALHGETLDALRPSATATDGASNVDGLVNDRAFSAVFGKAGERWHAWVLANRTGVAGEAFSVYRWDLTPVGLANPLHVPVQVSDQPTPTHVTLMPGGDGFQVEDLFGVIHAGNHATNQSSARRIAPDLSGTTGLTGPVMSDTRFAEATWVFELDDGLVLDSINVGDFGSPEQRDGDFGNFSEWTRAGVDDPAGWGSEARLDAPGPGHWRDMNYARDTSHAGQTDFIQLIDGTVYNAYVTNVDRVDGDFGDLVLRRRGGGVADGWSTVSLDAAGDRVWHVALTSDGDNVWLLYVKDDAGGRDASVFLRGYDPVADAFTDETEVAAITEGRRFERMTTQWRFFDRRLVVLWSQTADDGATVDVLATSVLVPEPGALTLMAAAGAAALRRPGDATR